MNRSRKARTWQYIPLGLTKDKKPIFHLLM